MTLSHKRRNEQVDMGTPLPAPGAIFRCGELTRTVLEIRLEETEFGWATWVIFQPENGGVQRRMAAHKFLYWIKKNPTRFVDGGELPATLFEKLENSRASEQHMRDLLADATEAIRKSVEGVA